MRGRKEAYNSYSELFAVRITKNQKEILDKNQWIKEEVIELVRNHINIYIPPQYIREEGNNL